MANSQRIVNGSLLSKTAERSTLQVENIANYRHKTQLEIHERVGPERVVKGTVL